MKSLKLVNFKKKLEVRFLKKIEKKKSQNFVKKFPNAHTLDLVIFFYPNIIMNSIPFLKTT